jgi:lipopolysaccharide/colanic/teichoic acid biosynthesis glycosyltransferase
MISLRTAADEPEAGAAILERPNFRARRAFELLLSALMLLALAPLIATIALAILIDLGRPIVFRQLRPGRHMQPFTLFKFRTMRAAHADGAALPDHQRTTTLGRFLRRSHLDELPQLFNVLRGDMSFIGPRPLLPADLPDDVARRAMIRPGITGWAQVNGGQKLSSAEKAALDNWYVQHASVLLDLHILYLTLKAMIFGERINHLEVERATAGMGASRHSFSQGLEALRTRRMSSR